MRTTVLNLGVYFVIVLLVAIIQILARKNKDLKEAQEFYKSLLRELEIAKFTLDHKIGTCKNK